MDQIKVGKCIALLRKRRGLTQEALGESLGVTNKTVSRWENGNYMPDIEMLSLLSRELGVSVDELLSGEILSEEERKNRAGASGDVDARAGAFPFGKDMADKKKRLSLTRERNASVDDPLGGDVLSEEERKGCAEVNGSAAAGTFSLEERKAYFKKKWRKEHKVLTALPVILLAVAVLMPFVLGRLWLIGLAPLAAVAGYGYQNNRMMIYVEHCLYD